MFAQDKQVHLKHFIFITKTRSSSTTEFKWNGQLKFDNSNADN